MANLISNLTNFANQITLLQLEDGSAVTLELIYQGTTERWIANVSYGTRAFNGIGICCFPNIMRQWRNVIPFGIACTTADQTDPVSINDFLTGRASVYLLSAADVLEIEALTFGVSQ